jgi:two-component system phosphate regulon sensor histidine kinase PhoR
MRFPPATVHLRRAQLTLMLAVLIPTALTAAFGIVLAALGKNVPPALGAVLILTFCATGITGYILGSILVGKGASLAQVQNDFVSSVSHELKTPLTSIHLLLASLRDGRLPPEDSHRVLALLGQETTRLEQLVGRLLELTRLETGAHVFARTSLPVSEVIADALAAFDASTLSQPTTVTVSAEPGLTIVGDRATLVSALVNLLTNAWKYTDEDKRIEITTTNRGRWTEIAVTDNGIGMTRDEQKSAFTHFTRGKSAIDRRTPGVGLGLAFVRAIMRGHRGKVLLESAVGRGTTVRLRFRRGRRTRPERTAAATAAPAHARPEARIQ